MQRKKGDEMVQFLSLEDLFMFVTGGGTGESASEAKRPRRSKSIASSSCSFEARCHVGIFFCCLIIDHIPACF